MNPVQVLPSPHPAVVFQQITEGAVLLHMEDEIYFGLNAVGVRVWQMLPPECAELDELCLRLSAAYTDADPAVIRADVVELLENLRAQRLVVDPS